MPTNCPEDRKRDLSSFLGEKKKVVLKTNERSPDLLFLKQRFRFESVLESKQKLFAL